MSIKKCSVVKRLSQAKAKVEDKGSSKEVVLLCGVGTSPAVLTETVWAMVTEMGVVPDKVVAITTTKGAKQIREKLLESGVWEEMRAALKKKRFNIEGKLSFGSQSSICVMSMGSSDLEDITTPEENMAAADFILKEIRGYPKESTIVYASLAGGRKTMSALMLSCMSLLAREEDHVLHVLVNEPFEGGVIPDFFYPDGGTYYRKVKGEKGEKCTVKPKIDLIDLPFVKVRSLYEENIGEVTSYRNLVIDAQRATLKDEFLPQIKFDFINGKVYAEDYELKLSSVEFMTLFILLTERPNSNLKLANSLLHYRSKKLANENDWGSWFYEFLKSPRLKTTNLAKAKQVQTDELAKKILVKDAQQKIIGNISRILSDLRKHLKCKLLSPAIIEKKIAPRGELHVVYPSEKISADIQELEAQFKE